MRDPAPGADLDAWIAAQVAWAGTRDTGFTTHAYGPHPEQVGDLRLPAGPGPHPVAVIIHGGAYREHFTRKIMDANAVDLTARGYATWNIEYRRTDRGGGAAATTSDVAAAIAHLNALPVPPGTLDTGRTVVIGHSAGGQLALWSAHLPEVHRVIALAAVCDLAALATTPDTPYARFVGGLPEQRPGDYALLDPARYLPTGAEHAILCGLDDSPGRIGQNREFAARAAAAGERVSHIEIPDTAHFTFMDARSTAWSHVVRTTAALLRAPAERR